MNEQGARNLVLAWAFERSDAGHKLITPQQRAQWADTAWARSHSQADGQGASEHFLTERAALLLRHVEGQAPDLAAFIARNRLFAGLAAGLPVAAFLVGLLVDRIGNPHRVDVLSAPLWGIVLWNLLVYVWLLGAAMKPQQHQQPSRLGWLARCSTGLAWMGHKMPAPWPATLGTFASHWARTSAPLARMRALRVLHACAAALAIGAMASLYARGLLVQYQVGWESTFLQADQVHALLSILFKPALLAFGVQGFSLADVQALQWPQTAPVGGGARWVHLYAATLLLLVVVPRGVLSAVAYLKERRLARRFRADASHPYVRDLLGAACVGTLGAMLQVRPYSFTVDAPRQAGLQALARAQLGGQAQVQLQAATAYGDDVPPASASLAKSAPALTVALFNLSATPEAENQGAFLRSLVEEGHPRLEVWVDASAYEQRLAGQSGSTERIVQRSALWQSLGNTYHLPVRIVHLLQPEASSAAAQLAGQECPVVLA